MSTEKMLDKSGAKIRGMFGAIAPWYDRLNQILSLNIDKSWRRKAVKLASPIPGNGPILDVATGTGDLALEFRKACRGNDPIIGLDFCGPLLDRAVRKARMFTTQNLSFVQGDAMNLPFLDQQFQIASIAFGLRNIADTDQGLSELIRVTQPGGKVVILEFSKPNAALLKSMYFFYFRKVLPKIGQWLSKSPDDAYSYLPESVMRFPDGKAMLELMTRHGLKNASQLPLTLGIASIYIGTKP